MRALSCVGLVGVLVVGLATQVPAQPPGTFSLPTFSVTDCALPLVNISTTEAGGTLGYDFDITFNPAVLSVASVDLGSLTADCPFYAWNADTPGTVAISIACTTHEFGGGTVASIQFVPVGVGSSALSFSTCYHDEVACTNPTNGNVQVSGCPNVDLTNTGRGTYGLSPGRVCVSGLLTSNGSSVRSASNELSFDSSVLAIESCFINDNLIGLGKTLSRTVLGAGHERVTVSGGAANLPNGILYACTLTVAAEIPNGPYQIDNTPGATGPGGLVLPTGGLDGVIQVTGCGADCDGNGSVSIGEVSRARGLFLGEPLCNSTNVNLSCPIADTITRNGSVTIGEVTRANCLFQNNFCSIACP